MGKKDEVGTLLAPNSSVLGHWGSGKKTNHLDVLGRIPALSSLPGSSATPPEWRPTGLDSPSPPQNPLEFHLFSETQSHCSAPEQPHKDFQELGSERSGEKCSPQRHHHHFSHHSGHSSKAQGKWQGHRLGQVKINSASSSSSSSKPPPPHPK